MKTRFLIIMNDKYRKDTEDNVYALRVDGSLVFIADAESGRKGYFCEGCNGEMQAKKGKIKHHFSHQPYDVTRLGKCTFSDETTRHRLAKESLQRLKQIKVPALYKYPPKDVEGTPNKLRDAHIISAFGVENELYFYENEIGDVSFVKAINWHDGLTKSLLIKPDVTFFNEFGKPILLIEIVATHKVSDEKKIKIRRLGIDTVQVTIPRDSPAEIEETFKRTDRTKWIYNNEQAKTEYLRIPDIVTERVSSVDELQREFFEESFKCRASQIGTLIRRLDKCLVEEQYRNIEFDLREEILRTQENTERNRKRLGEIQGEIQGEVDGQYRPAKDELEEEERGFREHQADIESKYNTETRRISKAESEYKPECQSEIESIEIRFEELGTSPKAIDARREEINREETSIQSEEGRLGFYIIDETERIGRNKRNTAIEIERITEQGEDLPRKYREIENRVRREFSDRETKLREEFDKLERIAIDAIEKRDSQSVSQLSARIKRIIDAGGNINTINQTITCIKRIRAAKEAFDSKSYKNWKKS